MDTIPKRTGLAMIYRSHLSKWEKHLIFPVKNPSYYQIIRLLLSIGYLFTTTLVIQSVIVAMVLILDWIDGAAARKYKLTGKEGWIIDVLVDRLNEGFIFTAHLFTPIGTLFFVLYLLNIALSLYSVKTKKHYILPLLFVWLVILLTKIWIF